MNDAQRYIKFRDEFVERELRMLTRDELIEHLKSYPEVWEHLWRVYGNEIDAEWQERERDRLENA